MLEVSRRGFLVLGGTGAAGVALAACGQGPDQRDDASPDDLTAAEASAETALAGAYGAAASALPPADGGPDSPEALDGAVRAANAAIVAHREAAGLLDTPEGRALASSSLVACAAELAAVDHFAGKEQAPSPFVTGATATPYEAANDSTTSTTSTTSSTSTTTTGGG